MTANPLKLLVTLWPSFPHFKRFANDTRLAGIRLNSAMIAPSDLDRELALAREAAGSVPLWFDVKGRQPRVTEVLMNPDYLDMRMNHPVEVATPSTVLFKAGADGGVLERLEEDGRRLIFRRGTGPANLVRAGESLHFLSPHRIKADPLFTPTELEKIERVKAAGISRWFVSYVEGQRDVDAFRELVGPDAELILKIETPRGVRYATERFRKQDGVTLCTARGDLYVESFKPHQIIRHTRNIVARDPQAIVGSRILLSTVHDHVPSCADFSELAWLADIGYQNLMLCDEMCLKEEMLSRAVNAFMAFKRSYNHR